MLDVAIVIPCFNEAARLDCDRVRRFLAKSSQCRLLFVNDGSTDGTQALLDALEVAIPERVASLALDRNRGKAEAVRRGMLAALEWRPAYVGYWDADLATPLEVTDGFRDHLERHPEHEVVMGARVRLLGRQIRRSGLRHYAGRLSATAIALALGMPVYDTQCGAKMFRARAVPDLFGEPFVSAWIFDVEVLARLIRSRRGRPGPAPETLVYEYPLERWEDVRGSKLGLGAYLRALVDLVRVHRRYLRPARAPGRGRREDGARS